MYKAVIFDMDDTLIQTRVAKYAAHKHTARHFYNVELTDEAIDVHWGKPFPVMMEAIYGKFDLAEESISKYLSVTNQFPIRMYSGAKKMVKQLALRMPLGLVTAADNRLMTMAMRDAGISTTDFEYIQTSDDSDHHKPDPQVFVPAIEYFSRQGITRDELLYVGDALTDYLAASGAGLGFVGIAGHTNHASVFDQVGARSITKFKELLEILS